MTRTIVLPANLGTIDRKTFSITEKIGDELKPIEKTGVNLPEQYAKELDEIEKQFGREEISKEELKDRKLAVGKKIQKHLGDGFEVRVDFPDGDHFSARQEKARGIEPPVWRSI